MLTKSMQQVANPLSYTLDKPLIQRTAFSMLPPLLHHYLLLSFIFLYSTEQFLQLYYTLPPSMDYCLALHQQTSALRAGTFSGLVTAVSPVPTTAVMAHKCSKHFRFYNHLSSTSVFTCFISFTCW